MPYVIETNNKQQIAEWAAQGHQVHVAQIARLIPTASGYKPGVTLQYWVELDDAGNFATWTFREHRLADTSGAVDLGSTLLRELVLAGRNVIFEQNASPY